MNVQLVVDHIHCDKTSDVGPQDHLPWGRRPTQPLSQHADLCRYLLITLPTGAVSLPNPTMEDLALPCSPFSL